MIVRGTYPDTVLEAALPALDFIMTEESKTYPEVGKTLYRQRTATRAIEQITEQTGIGQMREIGENDAVQFDDPVQGFDKTFKMRRFGLGVMYSQDAFEDFKHNEIGNAVRGLKRSEIDTRETHAAEPFNNAFTAGAFAGPDGKALCANNHQRVKAGTTETNILAVASDLDQTSLELALTAIRNWKNHSGKPMKKEPKKLLIAVDNEWNASEMLSGPHRSDTSNRAVNVFKHRIGMATFGDNIIPWNYLTDLDAWFILSDPVDTGLIWYWKRKPYTKSDRVFLTESMMVATRMRYDYGFHTWEGVFGTPGA